MNTTCYVGCTPPPTSVATHGPIAHAPAAAPLAFSGADIAGLLMFGLTLTIVGALIFTLSRAWKERIEYE